MPGSFSSNSASAAGEVEVRGHAGAAVGRDREEAEPEPADRREVAVGGRRRVPSSGNDAVVSEPQIWWNSCREAAPASPARPARR